MSWTSTVSYTHLDVYKRQLLDRFLLMMERQKVETVICLNKQDLADPEETEEIQKIYGDCGLSLIHI